MTNYTVTLTEGELELLLHSVIGFSDVIGDSLATEIGEMISSVVDNSSQVVVVQREVENYVDTMILHERIKAKLQYAQPDTK